MDGRGTQTAMEPDRIRRRWYFHDFTLDERTHELRANEVEIEIERKPLEVLLYLLQHSGEVCTKDELIASVWPGRVLSDTALTKCIGRLRELLGDNQQEIIKTVYGFGYRFTAQVRVESAAVPQAARLELTSGDHPVGRPLWSLVEKLGGGGHGDAWRARHDKTNEQRVFKFALDEASLVTLKREITLFRVINDTLGERARVVKLLDWNLEQTPYFLESEYIAGGNLLEWVQLRGGPGAIAMPERLEIVAQIADALGAVHSVGVLHKDLKPSNVLIRPTTNGTPEIVLADFGSGGILDAARLERLGITRLGFTRTLASIDGSSGTPLYLAPEVLAGQPFTVKSDMYALGIMLYQFLCGDFHKVMSPGWERGIGDELLREDIAILAEGNPAERLGDAEALARRLRTLDERHVQLAAKRDAQARAERARRLLERAQARRLGLVLAFAALSVGLVASTAMYFKARHAQQLTIRTAAQSQAVKDFLGKDVFAPVASGKEPVKDMTVIQLLKRAGNEIDAQFRLQPDVAAELHYVMGRSFQSFLESSEADQHYKRALDLGERLSGPGSRAAMRSASELIQEEYFVGQLEGSITRYNTILAEGRRRYGEDDIAVLDLRVGLAEGYHSLGYWASSEQMFLDVLRDVTRVVPGKSELQGRARLYYGQLLIDLSRPPEAERELHTAIDYLTSNLGERHMLTIEAHSALGRALADEGRFPEAAIQLKSAQKRANDSAPDPSWVRFRPEFFTSLLLLHQDRPADATPGLLTIIRKQEELDLPYIESHRGQVLERDHTGPVLQALGEAYMQEGRVEEAVGTFERAVTVFEDANGARHPFVLSAKLALADALIADHRVEDARRLIGPIRAPERSMLPPGNPILTRWHRVTGLLHLDRQLISDTGPRQ